MHFDFTCTVSSLQIVIERCTASTEDCVKPVGCIKPAQLSKEVQSTTIKATIKGQVSHNVCCGTNSLSESPKRSSFSCDCSHCRRNHLPRGEEGVVRRRKRGREVMRRYSDGGYGNERCSFFPRCYHQMMLQSKPSEAPKATSVGAHVLTS